jgi:hypothetical protein
MLEKGGWAIEVVYAPPTPLEELPHRSNAHIAAAYITSEYAKGFQVMKHRSIGRNSKRTYFVQSRTA